LPIGEGGVALGGVWLAVFAGSWPLDAAEQLAAMSGGQGQGDTVNRPAAFL
jgi:hypothetical protein